MRAILWLLALFAMAVALALFAGNNQGTVTLYWPPYRLDISLNLVLLALGAVFVLMYAALRALAVLLSLPGEARRWRIQHQERAMQLGLIDALSHLAAGRFLRARKAAEGVLQQERALTASDHALPYAARLRAVAHLLSAESTHALQDRAARDEHVRQALELPYSSRREEQELREGLQLRAARWAFDDRDVQTAQQRLDELPQGVARRTLALRLRLKVAQLARQTQLALETARLLAKHRAFTDAAGRSILRGLALELVSSAHDPAQLKKAWSVLDVYERNLPDVALLASERLLACDGEPALAQQWLLPIWEQMVASEGALMQDQQLRLVHVLENSFAVDGGAPDAAWLSRIEAAQQARPRDAALQYLAGVACMRLNLWGKAQQLLRQSLAQQAAPVLRRNAWRALALLAEQREDPVAAAEAWRQAAQP